MNVKSLFFLLLVLLASSNLLAQRVKRVNAEYTYHAPENVTLEEAKRTALDRAKLQAIADEFGTLVSQSNSTIVRNENGKSSVDIFSLGGSDVKGEWVETIKEPEYNITYEQGMLVVQVSVVGRIREIINAKVECEIAVLRNGTERRFEDAEFRNGDDMYLYFKAPLDGYLAVYFLDETTMDVFCLLPYLDSSEGAYRIKHDKPYIFFSKKVADRTKEEVVEYTLTAGRSIERNTLYIIFSPNEFIKANTDNVFSATLPRQLSYQDFNKWLSKLQLKDNKVTVESRSITITK